MNEILIVSSTENGRHFLEELLRSHAYSKVLTASSGSAARRLIIEGQYDLVLINTPLCDEFGHELAVWVAEQTSAGVMMLVKTELADEISYQVEDDGVFVVSKPVSRQLFFQSLKLLEATCSRLQQLKKENRRLRQKIEEMRVVNRAKCALVQFLGFSEAQAHRYIEKQAMDMRITKQEVAEDVLRTYTD